MKIHHLPGETQAIQIDLPQCSANLDRVTLTRAEATELRDDLIRHFPIRQPMFAIEDPICVAENNEERVGRILQVQRIEESPITYIVELEGLDGLYYYKESELRRVPMTP